MARTGTLLTAVLLLAFYSPVIALVRMTDHSTFSGNPVANNFTHGRSSVVMKAPQTAPPRLTIRATVETAFESGQVEGVFVIVRSRENISEPMQVRLQITGPATNGVDYQTIPDVVQMPAGSTSVEVRVRPIDDAEAEADELVTIGLADLPTNHETNNTRASVVIKDNDTVVQVFADASGSEAGPKPVIFRFTRVGNPRAVITVNYSVNSPVSGFGDGAARNTGIVDGTSNTIILPEVTSGIDFNPLPGSISFSVGESSKTLSVLPIDDSVSEPRESINITLLPSPFYTIGSSSSAVGFIEDNDTEVQVFTQNARGAEAGRLPATFRFIRAGDSTVPLTVSYRVDPLASGSTGSILDGTSNTIIIGESSSTSNIGAVSGSDFVALPGTVTFQQGEDTKLLDVIPIDDTIVEGTEFFKITLLQSSLYKLGQNSSAAASIEDNDQFSESDQSQVSVVRIQATVSEAREEGPTNGVVTISRTGSISAPLSVLYSINGPGSGGNLATNGVDFEELPGQIVIPAGSSSATVTVRPIVDDLAEPEERIVFQLLSAPNYTIQQGLGQATVRIKDHRGGGRP